jgi:hypothetical protein
MRDPHIRYPDDPGPLAPDATTVRLGLRYSWLPGDDPDVQRLRCEVQEEGRGLFVLAAGDTGVKVLVEAYYPEDIRPEYYHTSLDRYRKHEHDMGRLVAINEIFSWVGEMHPLHMEEIRRNNRNARKDLKREHNPDAYEREARDIEDEQTRINSEDFNQFYADAYAESLKFAVGTPRVSGYTPKQSS